jgi:hypothetical protein
MDSKVAPPKKLCEHRCIKSDGHDGEHFYGYAMGPSVPVYTKAEVQELKTELQKYVQENHELAWALTNAYATIELLETELEAYGV